MTNKRDMQRTTALWLNDELFHGLNDPASLDTAQIFASQVAEALAAGNIAAVAERPSDFFVYLMQTGYPGKGLFSDCLIDNTLAVVNRLSAEMRSALHEHDRRRQTYRDALTLAKNWIASYGPLCRWASYAWAWRCREAGLFDNPPPCDWDASGEIRQQNVRVGVFAPLIDAHENASALLAVAVPERAVVSMACAWLRSEDQSLDSAQPPCDAGKDVHEGLPVLRRIVFGLIDQPEGSRTPNKRPLTKKQRMARQSGGHAKAIISDEDAKQILQRNKIMAMACIKGRASWLVKNFCSTKDMKDKNGMPYRVESVYALLRNKKRQRRLGIC